MPTSEPFVAAPRPNPSPHTVPCPCGRTSSLLECCLPLAQRLRSGPARAAAGSQPSPFDEIRASCALLLWSLVAQQVRGMPLRRGLSTAAREFWGVGLSGSALGNPDATPTNDAARAALTDMAAESGPGLVDTEAAYADALFDRTWGLVDGATRTWMLGALASFVRADPLVGELALDWLLWDKAWLRGQPACAWLLQTPSFRGRTRVQQTCEALLRSRLGLWRLEEVLPGRGFVLTDRLGGNRTLLHTTSEPWPDTDRLLLARIYTFGRWRLLAGRCLLLATDDAAELIESLCERALILGAPSPNDPRWLGWLKPQMIPAAVNRWIGSRLALPAPGRYHGTHC